MPSHKRRSRKPHAPCSHCGATETPLWRKGPEGNNSLCNSCGVYYMRKRTLEGKVINKNAIHRKRLKKPKVPKIKNNAPAPHRNRKRRKLDASGGMALVGQAEKKDVMRVGHRIGGTRLSGGMAGSKRTVGQRSSTSPSFYEVEVLGTKVQHGEVFNFVHFIGSSGRGGGGGGGSSSDPWATYAGEVMGV